ncbi:MAG: phosphatase PAP2 family protein [Myxococcota bacterium]
MATDIDSLTDTAAPALRRRRLWTYVRPEEWLALAVLGVFLVLDLAGIMSFRLRTNFIKAGSDTAAVFGILATGVAAWRVMRKARARPDDLPWWMTTLLVLVPIAVVGVLAVHLLPFGWDGRTAGVAWALLGVLVAWFVVRGARRPARAATSVAEAPEGTEPVDAVAAPPAQPGWDGRALKAFALEVPLAMLEFVRTWAPFIVLLAAYENALSLVLEVNPHLYDEQISRLDEVLFGGHLDVWLQKVTSGGLTEVMAFFYDSLYVYPIVIGMALMFQRRSRELRSFLMSFVLAGYVGYVGYMFVPVIGPAFYYPKIYDVDLASGEDIDALAAPSTTEGGEGSTMSFYLLSRQLADKSTYGGNTPRNCFPSLHVGWAAVVLIFAWRYLRKLFYVLAIPLTLLITATSYLRYHYVTDIVAGILLAVLVSDFAPRIIRGWDRLAGHTGAEAPGGSVPSDLVPPRRRKLKVALRYGLSVGFFLFVVAFVYSWSPPDRATAAATLERRYIRADAPTLPEDARVGATFGGNIELLGMFADAEWRPGHLVTITSWWRCDKPIPGRRWKMFLHVRSKDGGMVVNADHQPVFDAYPLARWKAGEYIEDVAVVRIPDGRAVGEPLEVWVGFFDTNQDDKRLKVGPPRYPRTVVDDAVKTLERTLQP